MKLLPFALLVPVLSGAALLTASERPAEPPGQGAELPLLYYWSAEVREDLWVEWSAQRREVEFHIEDHHAAIYSETGYEEHLDDTRRAHQFGEVKVGATVTELWDAYLADQQWRMLDAGERDLLVDRQMYAAYLIPIAGRSPQGRMNVRYVQKARARMGGLGRSQGFARELVEHVNANYDGMLARAYVQETGEAGWIWLLSDFSSLGAWQEHRAKLAQDPVYAGLFEQAEGAFVEGSATSLLLTGV